MHIKKHADNTERLYGYRAEDIHEWIDQYFDSYRFKMASRHGFNDGWDPYEHRRYLHHREGLPKAIDEFRGRYPDDIIKKIFLQHLKDDYQGYIPNMKDFDNPDFIRKYHRRR